MLTYQVVEFAVNAATPDPATSFMTPVAAGAGNVKLITLQVVATGPAKGRRTVTVEAVKHVR
jgi:hypothetical protein